MINNSTSILFSIISRRVPPLYKKILEIKVANIDDATANKIEYSAYHYVNNVLSSEVHKSSAYGDLLRALYQYGEAAKKYFVQTNMG